MTIHSSSNNPQQSFASSSPSPSPSFAAYGQPVVVALPATSCDGSSRPGGGGAATAHLAQATFAQQPTVGTESKTVTARSVPPSGPGGGPAAAAASAGGYPGGGRGTAEHRHCCCEKCGQSYALPTGCTSWRCEKCGESNNISYEECPCCAVS